ncbi:MULTISPECIES: hypothetical protein [unclassified Nocardioides]|uniref:hypothetical protein n=1 Tax=unclassified Nocardioides TaxID=2615069 RepID=UPI003615FD49
MDDRHHRTDLDLVPTLRTPLRVRHAAALTSLLEERPALRGVHAFADYFDDAIRWSA